MEATEPAKISIKTKKFEAIDRMKLLGIHEDTIRQFEEDDRISRSEPPFGAFYWVEGKDLDRIRNFENEYNALVYAVIRTNYEELGPMDSYLYVSDHEYEWERDRAELRDGEPCVWVENLNDPICSEFGSIGIALTPATGLARTY